MLWKDLFSEIWGLTFGILWIKFSEFYFTRRVKYNGKCSFYLLYHLLMHCKVPCKERDCWKMEGAFLHYHLKVREKTIKISNSFFASVVRENTVKSFRQMKVFKDQPCEKSRDTQK